MASREIYDGVQTDKREKNAVDSLHTVTEIVLSPIFVSALMAARNGPFATIEMLENSKGCVVSRWWTSTSVGSCQ